jgi:chorismate-pyruvate lyase
MKVAHLAALIFLAPLPAAADQAWPDSFTTRLEATALVETANADVLASSSATLALDQWCAEHRLAPAGTKVVAHLVRGADVPASPETRKRLDVRPEEKVKYRRVELMCGERLLSVADNWSVPGRLTAEMNQALESTDIAFGRAVLALGFSRRTFAVDVLWHPLPEHWEMQPAPSIAANATLTIPDALFEHHAVLYRKDGAPFSEVRETYQRALLDFPLPK